MAANVFSFRRYYVYIMNQLENKSGRVFLSSMENLFCVSFGRNKMKPFMVNLVACKKHHRITYDVTMLLFISIKV